MWIPNPVPNCENINFHKPDHVNDDYCSLLGWYMAEGSASCVLSEEGNLRSARLIFSLSSDETEEAKQIEKYLLALSPPKEKGRGAGARVSIHKKEGSKSMDVRYGSVELYSLLSNDAGEGAQNKVFPNWLLYGDEESLKKTLKTILLGDGHIKKGITTFSSISEHLAYSVAFAFERLGIGANLRTVPEHTGNDGIKRKRCYEVRVRNNGYVKKLSKMLGLEDSSNTDGKIVERMPVVGDNRMRKITSVKRKGFKGKVYNLWIDEKHSYVTNVGLVGNCHPRDNIALSWLSREMDLSFDFFEAVMMSREKQTEWFADLVEFYDLPKKVILGKSFKPETNLTVGSPSILLKNVLKDRGVDVEMYDNHVDNLTQEELQAKVDACGQAVYFIGTRHDSFKDVVFPEGSVVVDPNRYIADQDGVDVVRLGENA
jgi:hypothetical protein